MSAALRADEAAREYDYRVDAEGRVSIDGSEVTDPGTLRFFLLAMRREPDGRHLVLCQGERNWFAAEDTPFVVLRLALRDGGEGLEAATLCLAGDLREALDVSTLERTGERLYCRVRGGAFRARLGRQALQQLAPYLEETGEGLALRTSAGRRAIGAAEAS
jgi:hypothetical protein